METDLAVQREAGVQGMWVRGEVPKELVLSDGTRLRLEPAEGGRVEWRRTAMRGGSSAVSVDDARDLAGDDFDGYVTVRTRAETEWLHAVAEWCEQEAGRLERQLET